MARRIKIEGMSELMAQLDRMGKNFPQSRLDKITQKAINPVLQQARINAPLGYTHQMEAGIIEVKEKKKRNKSVRQVVMDRRKTSIFRKDIENPGIRGGDPSKDTAYYPTSVEYGFHVAPGKKVMGQFFLSNALKKNRTKTRKLVASELSKAIDDLTR